MHLSAPAVTPKHDLRTLHRITRCGHQVMFRSYQDRNSRSLCVGGGGTLAEQATLAVSTRHHRNAGRVRYRCHSCVRSVQAIVLRGGRADLLL